MDPYPSNVLMPRYGFEKLENICTGMASYVKGLLIGTLDIKKGENVKIGRKAIFMGKVVLEDDVVIGDGAFLENVVIQKGTILKPGARVTNSVVGKNCSISGEIHYSTIGDNVILKNGAHISNAKIGDDSFVGTDSCVGCDEKRILIGNKVVINSKVWIKSDIGNHCVVGRGAVLTQNLRDNTLVNMAGGKTRIIENADLIM